MISFLRRAFSRPPPRPTIELNTANRIPPAEPGSFRRRSTRDVRTQSLIDLNRIKFPEIKDCGFQSTRARIDFCPGVLICNSGCDPDVHVCKAACTFGGDELLQLHAPTPRLSPRRPFPTPAKPLYAPHIMNNSSDSSINYRSVRNRVLQDRRYM